MNLEHVLAVIFVLFLLWYWLTGGSERFDSIFPSGRDPVNCVNADYVAAGNQCSIFGPYISQ